MLMALLYKAGKIHNSFKGIFTKIQMDQYVQLIEKIAQAAKLSKEDIERKIEAKRAKLSGLVSKEGAAQIVAAELGVNFDKEQVKISVLVEGMKKANIKGKTIKVFPVRSYNKNGREGKVGNILIADDSANIKAVFWDNHHIGLIENGQIKEGSVLELWNGNVRNGELHLSSFGDIKVSNEAMDNVVTSKSYQAKNFGDVKAGQNLKTRAIIVQVFDPRYFEVCKECGKRVLEGECKIHGKTEGRKRALLNIVLDDGHESMRTVLFGEQIQLLGFTEEEIFSMEKFAEKKQSILGDERLFSGIVKTNALYNTTEFYIEQVEEVDTQELLKELEAKI